VPKKKTAIDVLRDTVRALDKRVKQVEEEIADMKKAGLEKLARILHGPSQPPPALPQTPPASVSAPDPVPQTSR
jgi:hypothetical protein